MEKLQGSQQLPLLAIFPADRPNRPVILKTYYSKAKVQEKLALAGPSLQRPDAQEARSEKIAVLP